MEHFLQQVKERFTSSRTSLPSKSTLSWVNLQMHFPLSFSPQTKMIFRTELFLNTTFKIQSPQIGKKETPKNKKKPQKHQLGVSQ